MIQRGILTMMMMIIIIIMIIIMTYVGELTPGSEAGRAIIR